MLGVCNGFQILCEAGLLPGALMRNTTLRFVCREVKLEVVNADDALHHRLSPGPDHPLARSPITTATTSPTPRRWSACTARARSSSAMPRAPIRTARSRDIAGIVNEAGNVLGLMPHPENLIEPEHGGTDGRGIFESALGLAPRLAA